MRHIPSLLLFVLPLLVTASLVVIYAHSTRLHKPSLVTLLSITPIVTPPSFTLGRAPQQSLQGKILSLSGQVDWQSRVATQPAQLETPAPILQGEELFTRATGKVTMDITTAAVITLSPNTHINLIQTLPTNIVIDQDQGTAIFSEKKASPLAVRCLGLVTQLKQGTSRISVDPDAGTVAIAVQTGSAVIAYNDAANNSHVKTIESGEQAVYDDTATLATITKGQ